MKQQACRVNCRHECSFVCSAAILMLSPPDSVGDGIMYSGCPSAAFVRSFVRWQILIPRHPECSSATYLSAETSRSRQQFSSTVTLAAHTVPCVVQTMYRINCCQAPKYITDLVSTVAATATRSDLRSDNTTNYCLPMLRTTRLRRTSFLLCWTSRLEQTSTEHSCIDLSGRF